ncbi:MAG: hypothetical protein JWO67_5636, partial [Streptosporangiaceae bacterium]|nr:hypothetical protein [Streptosporangiaceae bacterium]
MLTKRDGGFTVEPVNIRDLEPPPLTVPLSVDGSEVLTFDIGGPSGWAALHSPDTARAGLVVLLRFGPESDDPQAPILVRELHVAAIPGGSAPLSSPLLRMLPLARMVAAVNRESIREQLRPMLMPWNVGQAQHVGSRLIRWQFQPDGPTPLPQPNLELEVPNDR